VAEVREREYEMTKTRFLTALALVIGMMVAIPAMAVDITESGNAFLATCSVVEKPKTSSEKWNDLDFLHAGMCEGYMDGLANGIGVAASKAGTSVRDSWSFCLPAEVTAEQEIRIVLKYIREHPEQAHELTVNLAIWALQTAFPCAAKK